MTIGFIFWLLMILWAILEIYFSWPKFENCRANLLIFILLFLLGWGIFGFVIRGP